MFYNTDNVQVFENELVLYCKYVVCYPLIVMSGFALLGGYKC